MHPHNLPGDTANGKVSEIGQPGMFQVVDVAPECATYGVARYHRPVPISIRFLRVSQVTGNLGHKGQDDLQGGEFATQDQVPIDGVPTGRAHSTGVPRTGHTGLVEALTKEIRRRRCAFAIA